MTQGQNVYSKIYDAVRKVPYGQVASYGQIARLIGSPRAARIVGWALRILPTDTNVPWHRVLNKSGMISIENMTTPKEAQATLLRSEGVEIVDREGNLWVDLKKFGWDDTL